MNTFIINESTPLSFLTVGQFLQLLNDKVQQTPAAPAPAPSDNQKRLVYGLAGIRNLFNVSHATAFKYKEGILKDAVSQRGRKIVVDVDLALELFNSKDGRD